MAKRLESRLAKLERQRGEPDDPTRPSDFAMLCGYPRGTLLSTMHRLDEERMARETAAGTCKPPETPDADYYPENVVDVESELLKIQGDRDGWKARHLFLKRDPAAMTRRGWPDIDAGPPSETHDDQELDPPA